ncbi:chemerin-like receptor 2 [Hoplias malabaricus]|uniref:chemerin-like receptor 2 n=1 Tax=Hoplias malabaricus TaxID=27720 RepID=UPI003462D382
MMEVEQDYDNYTYDYLEYGDFEEPKAGGYVQKETLHIISVLIYSLAFVLGLIGNGIVIWVTAFKSKRTISSLWLQNLAIADFVFVLFLPVSIDYVLRDFNWIFGWNMCKLHSFVCTINMYASVLFLTVLSLDRYVSLVHLSWCQRFRTVQWARAVCALTWIVSILLSTPTLIFRETIQLHNKVVCFNNFQDENGHIAIEKHVSIVLLRTIVGFLLPLATISVTAVLLTRKMKPSGKVCLSSFSKTASAIVLAFFLCWAPFHIFSLMELTLHHSKQLHLILMVGFPLATSLAFFNSCLNPVLYVLVSKNVRGIIKTSCMNIAKQSLREFNQSLTESVSVPANCSPEEASACSNLKASTSSGNRQTTEIDL